MLDFAVAGIEQAYSHDHTQRYPFLRSVPLSVSAHCGMAIMDPSGDTDSVHRVWALLSEVSEQLSQNRASAVNLHALSDGTKVCLSGKNAGYPGD